MADLNTAIESLSKHFAGCPRRSYRQNDVIVTAGDESRTLYYLASGSVSVILEDQDGHELVLTYLNEGDFFGEIGMFDERHQRSAWVRARSRCEVASISYERLRELSVEDPDILFTLLKHLALRVRDTSRKVGDLAFKDVNGRIARTLLELCDQPDAVARDEGTAIDITRQELGRIVGCSREMASRVLRAMQDDGLLTVEGKTVVVHADAFARRQTG